VSLVTEDTELWLQFPSCLFYTFRAYLMILPVAQIMQHQIAQWLQE